MTAASTVPLSPLDAIDAALAERLLAAALSSGGDYADLYFEHRAGADYVARGWPHPHRRARRDAGTGHPRAAGDATGYAYTEELDEARMTEAARTAAQIAASGATPGPIAVRPVPLADRYPVLEPSLARAGRRQGRAAPAGGRGGARATTRASSASRRRWRRNGARSWSSPPTDTWRAISSR